MWCFSPGNSHIAKKHYNIITEVKSTAKQIQQVIKFDKQIQQEA